MMEPSPDGAVEEPSEDTDLDMVETVRRWGNWCECHDVLASSPRGLRHGGGATRSRSVGNIVERDFISQRCLQWKMQLFGAYEEQLSGRQLGSSPEALKACEREQSRRGMFDW